ncbi:MAG: A24 family peptidase [Desulfatitalea sp.]|nr:A24 family peptidase [Desulfatitalea sp.]
MRAHGATAKRNHSPRASLDIRLTPFAEANEDLIAPLLLDIYIFIVGICVGSFLNVCIFRLPSGRSIVKPPSACPKCGTGIRWYDNIPVVSYILLGGKCRNCRARVSLRYPTVELLTGLSALVLWLQFGAQWHTLIYFVFIAALLAITFIDIDHQIIPDEISLPGIPIGFALSFLNPNLTWSQSLIGIVVGAGALYGVIWCYYLATGRQGMGFGDVKLLGMIGAFIGWQGVLFTIMASSFIGTLVGLAEMIRTRQGMRLKIPFGPFLAIGAVLYLFFGPAVIDWYMGGMIG